MKKTDANQPTSVLSSPVNQVTFRVRYAETDAMGIVHHSRYLPWMELGRTELLRQIGFSYRQSEADGFFFPLIEATCRYHAPARYDDLVMVETSIKKIRPPYIEFQYRIYREPDHRLLVTGETKQVCVNKEGALRREPLRKMQLALNTPTQHNGCFSSE
ncbi:MAG: acyl-CoA thioesterase [Firmicutes bacterium]|nr:acyl-CoA thioesterase [Bacillota bacterium]